ncbi:MAG: glycosyltransferase [Bacilli bacterium]
MKDNNLSYSIYELKYGYGIYDFMLSDDDNIGSDGENLTIVILSFNRSESTIRLLESISEQLSNFHGKVLIADNNSNSIDIKKLKKFISKSSLDIDLVCFDKNYGVAGGRNRIINYVKTDWFMSLDNDIYFISNPLSEIQKTISLLGLKFINLPLISDDQKTIFSNGGSLFIDVDNSNNFYLGGGSMFKQSSIENNNILKPSLSTFLLGGSSVLNKDEFIRCGMFDENYFIGFEDIDFSISIFNKGLKIGNCPILSLVHNHTISYDKNSLEYEKTRFNSGILKKSSEYFEKKHNFKIWNVNLEMWIEQRQKELGVYDKKNFNKINKDKKKIALVVDVEGWCFWNISQRIKENLSEFYDFEIIPLDIIDNNVIKLLFYTKSFDLVHFFWRGHLSLFDSFQDYCNECGISYQGFIELYIKPQIITTSVYDHLYLDNVDFTNKILNVCKNYTVSSKMLEKIYIENKKIIKKPQMVITDGVDLNLFFPMNLDRLLNNKKLVIGWVGNSAWSNEIEDFKGFNTIIKPAIQELIDEGYPIISCYADKQEKMIPYEEMPDYYAKIDICLCASKMEGTPNPILESMACGIPIITTNVGIVSEVFGKKQKKFIVNQRTKEAFKEKIIMLLENRYILKELSDENLKRIKSWDWKIKTNGFKEFFDKNLIDK